MPILMTLIACAVLVVLQMTSSSFFVSQTKTYHRERSMAEKTEAVRLMGPVVREAFELRERSGGSCPSGTVPRTVRGVSFCWRSTPADGLCVKSKTVNPLWVCPATSGGTFVLGNFLFSKAYAGPIVVPNTAPVASVGITMRTPNCAGSTGPCITCSAAGTQCITLFFCVSSSQTYNCAASDRIEQTFAFRR